MVTHLIVDGSNIATEGRKLPSLRQLEDAVADFVAERPITNVVVIVDATFPNRIAKSETGRYEDLLEGGWLLTPPAGAIGRGDAFILQVAARVDSVILSNDSFQEFHGAMPWLFDEGRLVGGKPVPTVGWVFVDRLPVRGPTSRRSVRDAKRTPSDDEPTLPAKATDDDTATAAPARKRRVRRPAADAAAATESAAAPADAEATAASEPASKPARRTRRVTKVDTKASMNAPAPFVGFVSQFLPGSSVRATVSSFTSHGAYVTVGEVVCYAPNRLMGDPPPKSAKEKFALGDEVEFVVESIDAASRGIDLALAPSVEGTAGDERAAEVVVDPAPTPPSETPPSETPPSETPPSDGVSRRRTRKVVPTPVTSEDPGAGAKSSDKPAAGEQAIAEPPRKAPAKRAPRRRAVSAEATPAQEAPVQEAPVKKAPAKKAAAKKTPAKKAAAKKAPAKKAPAKKAPAKKAPAKKAPAKKAPAKKAPAQRAAGSD